MGSSLRDVAFRAPSILVYEHINWSMYTWYEMMTTKFDFITHFQDILLMKCWLSSVIMHSNHVSKGKQWKSVYIQ